MSYHPADHLDDVQINYTSNGVAYCSQLYNMHGAAFQILIDLDNRDAIPSNQQVQDAKQELLDTQDPVRISIVQRKNGEWRLMESREVRTPKV